MVRQGETLVARLGRQADEGRLPDDVGIVFRLRGGSHDEAIDKTVTIAADGRVHVRSRDKLGEQPEGTTPGELARDEVLELFRLLTHGIGGMVTREEARFVPDSLVGSVSLGVGDEAETYYFAADPEACEHEGSPIPEEVRAIVDRFQQIERTCLRRAGVPTGKQEGKD